MFKIVLIATYPWHHPHFLILSQEPSSVEKIMEIDDHIGCAMSGLIADARTLVEHARVETQVLVAFFFFLIKAALIFCLLCILICSGIGLYTKFFQINEQNHRFSYGEPMTVESTTQALCDLALRFGEGDEESMVMTTKFVNL